MSNESPNSYSPEERAKLQQSRTLSDAELIKRGANYVPNSEGEIEFRLKDHQIVEIYEEMKIALLKEKDPGRFEATYKEFIEHVEQYARRNYKRNRDGAWYLDGVDGEDIKAGYIDNSGQVIASENAIEEHRHEMYKDFMKTKDPSSKEYAEAAEYLRMVSPAPENPDEYGMLKMREEMYYNLIEKNQIPESEFFVELPHFLKPGVLESLTIVRASPQKSMTTEDVIECVSWKLGLEGRLDHGACLVDDSSGYATRWTLVFSEGRSIVFDLDIRSVFSEEEKKSPTFDKFKSELSSWGRSDKKTGLSSRVYEKLRELFKRRFIEIAQEQGFSDEQITTMIEVATK